MPKQISIAQGKPIKSSLLKSGVFAFAMLFINLFFIDTAFGQVTKTWLPTNGGNWLIAGNWSPGGVPGPTDHVLIPVDQSSAITRSSSNNQTIPLAGLTINGNVNFQFDPGSANFCTINITGTFTVAAGKTFTVGINNAGRLNFTLASTTTGTVNGTVFMNSYSGNGYDRILTNNGNLTISASGLITGQHSSGFILNSGASLSIANTAGITATGATGAVRVPGTRTYSTGANYVYNGTSAQAAGNGLPATVSNLTISNTAGVSLPSAKVITNNLSITAGAFINLGTFTHNAGTLTLGAAGTAAGSWGSTASTATNKNNTYFAPTTGRVNVTTSTCTPPSSPAVSSPVTYCQNTTAIALTATGSNLLWYTTATGGTGSPTAPTPVTTSVGTTPYFVSQTIGCEGPRAQINVIVNAVPVSSVTNQTNIGCFTGNDGTITVSASGGTSPYMFSVDNGTNFQAATGTDLSLFTGLLPNTAYTIKVKDNNGCISK